MLTVSEEWKNRIYDDAPALLLKADIILDNGNELYLDYEDYDDDFMSSGNTFEDSTSGENSFDIGQAIMNTFLFTLNNFDGRFDDVSFKNSVIIPYVGMTMSDGTEEWVKKGKFMVSDPGRRGGILSFTAYDFMLKLDNTPFSNVQIAYPTTIGDMAHAICTECGVTLATTTFFNSTYVVNSAPVGDFSCRQIISYIAQIAGCFARFNANGELEIKWYPAVDITAKNYHDITEYASLETGLEDVFITGIKVSSYYNEDAIGDEETDNSNVEEYLAGADGYALCISKNPLIPYGNAKVVADSLYSKLKDTAFRPLELRTFFDPSMEAGDAAVITDVDGNTYAFFVTNISAPVGSYVTIRCGAENTEENAASQYSGAKSEVLKALDIVNAKIQNLVSVHLESEVAKFGYATIQQADILSANIKVVSGDLADYKTVVAEQFSAQDAVLQTLVVKDAELEEAVIGKADITLANIDTANVNREKVKDLFVELGMIKEAVISEGRITGYLDAVKINASDIATGTLAVERLIISGSDKSIVYALNNMGELVSKNVDSIDGGVLTERTVTADRIVSHSITVNEVTTENLIGANGWINLADGTFNYGNQIAWDGKKLDINAEAVTVHTDGRYSTQSDIDNALANMKIGARNLIRNSKTLLFEKYYFESVALTDENGLMLTDEDGKILIA